ncbi:UPF0149 family protein [Lacimicrobium alkaliphilum]|uniref:YecA family protein n=1 Tax=Lacimicrobium alkaliphilum TaxID=1526571 RepID=A0A0U3B7H4_9ALTE|nr:UPF0149 family protein [Lacimicrobium alkaliphilum]ALS99513.1 hypothetical protein AT746_15430 [Lacimicrobium alkaliphilum]
MADLSKVFEQLGSTLQQAAISSDGAEIQGIITGMLAGGMPVQSEDWLSALADFVNQGEKLPDDVRQQIMNLYQQTKDQLMASDFTLTLCLPDDAAPINDRGMALVKWVQGFLLGFGLHQNDLTGCSEDVKEALEDFAEISRMDEKMSEGEDSEQALFEVMEYVRVSAMLCFNEQGRVASRAATPSKTLH